MSFDYLRYVTGVSRERNHIPAGAVLPLRLFLGATFIYAGLYKLTDPQFFSPTAPGFVGRQMSGFVRAGSPLSPLITHLALGHAAIFGALIALGEIWAGLSALTGLLTRAGAAGGCILSMTFFLTASWTVRPYFLGPDLPYALAWLTLALAGAGMYSLDDYFFGAIMRARSTALATPITKGPARTGGRQTPLPRPGGPDLVARAAFVRGISSAAMLALGSGVIGGLLRLRTGNRSFARQASALPAPAPTAQAAGPGAAHTGTTLLGNVKVLPLNSAGQYTDPISGDPALLIHLPDGHFVAYDAVCTHAGCTVQYDPSQHFLVCPCHGATFDPAHGAQVVAGPAPQPLAPLVVSIDARGNAYAKGVSGANNPAPTPGSSAN